MEGDPDQERLVLYKNHDGHKNQTRLDVRHDGLKSRWIKSITSMDVVLFDNLLSYTWFLVFLMSWLELIVCKPASDQHREVRKEGDYNAMTLIVHCNTATVKL